MFTVSFFTDHGCCYGSAHLYVNANACLYLQTQLLFYMGEQRRRTARRSAVFLLLSLPRRRLHCLPTSPSTVLDPTRANCCLVGKLRERNGMRTSECRAHHYCLFRSYCIPTEKGVFMRAHVNRNFFENDVVCTTLFLKTEGQKYSFL